MSKSGTWNPDVYLNFAAYRARPADDLIPRLTLDVPGAIYDLGCGPGTLTKRLKDRWPERAVIGVDTSAEMLASAQSKFGGKDITWRQGDIATWTPAHPVALLFANASLHWLSNHETLFPRLMECVAPGGLFAVQLPLTKGVPYQECLLKVAASPRWRDRLKGVKVYDDPHPAHFYYDLLWPLSSELDLWETDYHHILSGEDPVAAWMSGTGLVPFLSALDEKGKADLLADYAACTAAAYPRRPDHKVLFTMHRLFIVAKRRS
jgi:trans-aconitate 2-methyltransferase